MLAAVPVDRIRAPLTENTDAVVEVADVDVAVVEVPVVDVPVAEVVVVSVPREIYSELPTAVVCGVLNAVGIDVASSRVPSR